MRSRRLWAPVAAVSVVALTYLLGRLVVYLYVFDPLFSLGTVRQVPSQKEADAFGDLVGLWMMPVAFFVLTSLATFALARVGSIPRFRDGALCGLAAALLHQIAGLYFSPFNPAEAVTFFIFGTTGGLLGVAGGRRTMDTREALHGASREVAAARDPWEIVSAVGKHLAGPGVAEIILYTTTGGSEDANDGGLRPVASWHPPASHGPYGQRLGELLRAAATDGLGNNGQAVVLRTDGLSAPESAVWERAGVASVLLVPLAAPTGGRVGVLTIASRRGRSFSKDLPRAFPNNEARAYETVGPQAALVLENLRLLEEARRAGRQAGVLRERQRLAHEIHDTLAQGFTSIVTNLEAAEAALRRDPSAVRRHHEQIGRAARGGLDEARRLVWALSPAPLEGRALPEAIGELAREFSEENGIPAAFSVSGDPAALPEAAQTVLVRVSQEALQNVRKHAGASLSRVALTLSCMGDTVALDVRDDGVGFDPVTLTPNGLSDGGGFGLRAMRERVEGLGGSLFVETSPGEGTAVVAELPVAPSENEEGAP